MPITRKEAYEKYQTVCIQFAIWIAQNCSTRNVDCITVDNKDILINGNQDMFYCDSSTDMQNLYKIYRTATAKDSNYCDECDEPAFLEQSPEGQNCSKCGAWLCNSCTVWRNETPFCSECNKEGEPR